MFTVDNFMGSPVYDEAVAAVQAVNLAPVEAAPAASAAPKTKKSLDAGILPREAVKLGQIAVSKDDAIRQAGSLLVAWAPRTRATPTACSLVSSRSARS